MKKTTKKEIREYVRLGLAQDITAYDFDRAEQLRKDHTLDVIAVSRGVYGMTGAILQDENGERYAITARNSTLFQLV